MAKCPHCNEELTKHSSGNLYCKNCNKLFRVKAKEAPPPQAEEKQAPQATPEPQTEQPKPQNEDNELELLKARLALVEAEKELAEKNLQLAKQQTQNTQPEQRPAQTGSFKEKVSGVASKVAATPAWAWFKKHWYIPFASVLGLIIIITLMTTLVGIRGIYVNVNNPNEFYSFTATSYTSYSTEGGETVSEKGTWKTSGSKLTMTINDEDFGKVSEDFVFTTKKAYHQLFIGESKENLTEYKRVSIVNYDCNVAKVKVTFDMNGGEGKNAVNKVKQGNLLKKPEAPTHPEGYEFRGWYDTPYGYKNGGKQFNENYRIWEKVTYYANWDNPTEYAIRYKGRSYAIKEGDSLLTALNEITGNESGYFHFNFYLDDKLIDKNTYFTPSYNNKTVNAVLTSIEDGVTEIPEYAFKGCKTAESLTIPDSVTSIGNYAFYKCTGLTSVTIPINVTSIGESAFYECDELTTVNWDATECSTIIENSIFYNSGIFTGCKNLTTVSIGNNVTTIPRYAFYNCKALTSITIPDSITFVGHDAFDKTAWNDSLPDGLTYIGKVAYKYKDSSSANSNVAIKDGTTQIYYDAFCNCTALKSITIPNSITTISSDTFSGCSGLTSITIPNSVTSIGNYAFDGCSALTSITVPDSVTSIGYKAFYGCSGLVEMTIPFVGSDRNATSASSSTLFGYIFGESSYTGGTETLQYYSGSSAIYYIPTSLKKVTVKGGSILRGAFYNCSNLTSVTIGNNVTSIDDNAFYSCSGLTSITIDNGVTSIGDSAFFGCSGLTNITLPDSLTSIGKGVFTYCSGLTSVTIDNGVPSINDDAFFGCTSLTNITIPGSVTNIGYESFYGCNMLTEITFKGTKAQWTAIKKRYNWNSNTYDFTIHCTDGDLDKDGNEI